MTRIAATERTHGFFRLEALSLALALTFGCSAPEGVPQPSTDVRGRTALDDYIDKPDSSYRYELVDETSSEGFTTFVIDLTSQTWRSPSEVDRVEWQHWLTIVVPPEVESDWALLFIGGGSNGKDPPKKPPARFAAIAQSTRSVVAGIGTVPNQPLAFSDDNRPRTEDDLIAHTWNKYMETEDAAWLARMPMVKSAVRAMDTVQEFLASPKGGELKIQRFAVAGGSKRGWTTWLTGAVDDRVEAIIPIVIDVLNVIESMDHHYAAYGFWAPAIDDYVKNGVIDHRMEPRYAELMKLVDPYHYRHRLTQPKFIINSTGDEFFLPDSSQFYFDELQGDKYLRYVPNTKHSLDGSDAGQSLEAFYRSIITGSRLPALRWARAAERLEVRTDTKPIEARLWQATNPEARDFRLDTIGKAWTSEVVEPALSREIKVLGSPEKSSHGEFAYRTRTLTPDRGWSAYFLELTFDSGGENPLKLTTEVVVVPDEVPHTAKLQKFKDDLKQPAALSE